jgi:uncharacterized delta-60 repeat protein
MRGARASRLPRALLVLGVLLALCLGAATAQASSGYRGLDPSFGNAGIARVTVPQADRHIGGFEVAADGRIFVLDGSQLLAFESDGTPAAGFGEGGRVAIVVPARGEEEGEPSALAIDSQGRLLVTGSAHLQSQSAYEAYVIRLLANGSRDGTFGFAGEVDTDFGLPIPAAEPLSVEATSIYVDEQDRPVLGGSFGNGPCGYDSNNGPEPFVARLTTTGAIDETFAASGTRLLRGLASVESVAPLPGGGTAVFSRPCSFGARVEEQSQLYSKLTESGATDPQVKERPLAFTYESPEIDPKGRLVEIESVPPAAEGPDALTRYLPNGRRDRGFGSKGRVILGRKLGGGGYAFAVDAQGRPIVAAEARRFELRRFRPNGKLDRQFGPGGRLTAKAQIPNAIALDGDGRIYTVGLAGFSAQTVVQVARFIPGR